MRYYLNIPVPPELRAQVKAVEQRWQPKPSKSDPHITLLSPRSLNPGASEEALIAGLMEAFTEVEPFIVSMTGIDDLGSDKTIICIRVERSAPLAYCYENAMLATQDLLAPNPEDYANFYKPHITLAKRIPPRYREAAWMEISAREWSGRAFTCREVQLLRMAPKDAYWSVLASMPLNQHSP